MTTHPALPGLLLATAQEDWPTWHAVTRLVLADLLDEVGRPAPWLRRGLHPKALARALGRGRRCGDLPVNAWGPGVGGRPACDERCPQCRRRTADTNAHYSGLGHCLHLVRRHIAGHPVPPGVAAHVEQERRRFRRRALCLWPGVRLPCPWCVGSGRLPVVAPMSAGPCDDCGGTGRAPAPDLLPRESGRRGRHRRGHAALDRAISEAVLPPFPPA